jgi:hypothetical protein
MLSLTLAVMGCCATRAWSQSSDPDNGLNFSAAQKLQYDSNVFRLPNDTNTPTTAAAGQRSDVISTTQLGVSFDKDFGRHHLSLKYVPSVVRYLEFDQFDYEGNNAVADWKGHIGSDGGYGLRYEHIEAASNIADLIVPEKNIVTTDATSADLVLRTGSILQGVTTWRATRSRNSAELEQGGDNEGWSADAGLRMAASADRRTDLRYRHSQYEYPNVIPVLSQDNSYKQDEVELSWDWRATEPSRFAGRAAYVKRAHDHISERDFSGFVGNFKYIWQPTVASSLTANVFRELGAVTDASASYARTYGLSIAPSWEPVEKTLSFGGLLEWLHRSYEGFSLIGRPDERTVIVGLNTTYKPDPHWVFGFGINDERRHSSDAVRAYSVWTAMLSARWLMH